MKTLLIMLGGAMIGLAGPIWILYAVYSLFTLSLPFWSTVGASVLCSIFQVIIGALVASLSTVIK